MKKMIILLLLCFAGFNGLNGMKDDPALKSNLTELKTSLTTLKTKLGDLNKKLGDLNAKLHGEKAKPKVTKEEIAAAIDIANKFDPINSPLQKVGVETLERIDQALSETDKSSSIYKDLQNANVTLRMKLISCGNFRVTSQDPGFKAMSAEDKISGAARAFESFEYFDSPEGKKALEISDKEAEYDKLAKIKSAILDGALKYLDEARKNKIGWVQRAVAKIYQEQLKQISKPQIAGIEKNLSDAQESDPYKRSMKIINDLMEKTRIYGMFIGKPNLLILPTFIQDIKNFSTGKSVNDDVKNILSTYGIKDDDNTKSMTSACENFLQLTAQKNKLLSQIDKLNAIREFLKDKPMITLKEMESKLQALQQECTRERYIEITKKIATIKSIIAFFKIEKTTLAPEIKAVPEIPGKEKPAPEVKKQPAPETAVERENYGKKQRQTFFADFMGIEENSFDAQKIKDQIIFEEHGGPDGKPNFKIKDSAGKVYKCGFLEQISLDKLKAQAKAKPQSLKPTEQKPIIFNVIEASDFKCSGPVDIGALQADPINKNAVFQVASNFNALETTNHNDGHNVNTVANYFTDNTQGPRASISAAPGLIYRRYYYFYPERNKLAPDFWGQREQKNNTNIDTQGNLQINFLEDLHINTMNGYIWGKDGYIEGKFGSIPDGLQPNSSNIENIKEENSSKFKIGYHSEIQVTFGATGEGSQEFFYDTSQIIDQVFAAALVTQKASRQRDDQLKEATDERAKLILEWSYEAMLKSAFLKGKRDSKDKIKVFLTRIGGGAFANDQAWIDDAIKKAVKDPDLANSGLEITLNNFVFKEGIDDIEGIRKRLIKLAQEHNGVYKLYKVDGAYSLTLVGDVIQETKIAE